VNDVKYGTYAKVSGKDYSHCSSILLLLVLTAE